VFLDVVYAPWPSVLAGAWQQRGGVVIPGTRMLLHQAAMQVHLMTGVPAPVHSMRDALESVGAPV
jgi:shikimate dehydrogenase